MDNRERLKSMLNALINDKHEQAQLDLHSYLTVKMQEVSGLATSGDTEVDAEIAADGEV